MSNRVKGVAASILLLIIFIAGCKSSQTENLGPSNNANTTAAKPDADGVLHSGTGTEKEKPAAGKANVQGKVFYNEKPATDIEVKLCEKFSQYGVGCGGQTYTTKTDSNGEYLIKDVPPGVYEGLNVRVFNTPYYVFATSGIVSSAKYKLEADKTFFAPDTNLFKSDLKILSPKAGAVTPDGKIEVKWDTYPDAAYYKFSVHGDSSTGAKTVMDYVNKRIDGLSYSLDQPLVPGKYTVDVKAYNANNVKLAEGPDDISFTVKADQAK